MINDSIHDYKIILNYMLEAGKRIASKAGNIQDIGTVKSDLTEEDLAIERDLKKIIEQFGPDHTVYGEEENQHIQESEHLWIIDPISGTYSFIKGLGHYAIVVAHLHKGIPQFAVVYDPCVNELFTAQKGQGAYCNNNRINVSEPSDKKISTVFNKTLAWKDDVKARELWIKLDELGIVYRNANSFAVNYCHVACGRYDGVIALSKDTFPEYAGSLIIQEAGGVFTNQQGKELNNSDRIFIGGTSKMHSYLLPILSTVYV